MIEQLFGSKTRVKLLELFFQYPNRAFYVREMARTINGQLNAIRRELSNLEKIGLVKTTPSEGIIINDPIKAINSSRSKYYKLQKDCLIYFELKALLLKAQVLRERDLVEKLSQKAGKLKLLILAGIFTATEETVTDVFLVGDVKPLVVAKLIDEFEKKMGKAIRYTIMTEKEYNERKEIGDKFLYGILESKHVVIVNEL
jgi:DNA-binding transcriptional regulator YhcF (GntR family)